MQLIDIKEITGKIVLKSGLHIGAGDTEMHIGGTDNSVVKHPHSGLPYIPGSSLKGKVRALLELESGLMVESEGKPLQASQWERLKEDVQKQKCAKILKIFGSSGADSESIAKKLGSTRVSFADCPVTDTWQKKVHEERLGFFEVKSENTINRIRGTAEHPRFIERVPADTEFDFTVCLKILGKEDDGLLDYLLLGLKLLEMDSPGGSGSRGYGKIKFVFDDKDIKQKFEDIKPFENGGNES